MKVYEILSLNREMLERLHDFGISLDDYKWVGMYREFLLLRGDGKKVVYIVAFLAQKYDVCERKVYKVIREMNRDCHFCSAR